MDTPRTPTDQAAQEVVLIANPYTGQTEVRVATADDPSPESQRLAAALAELADPDAEVPPSTPWEDHSAEARQVKWLEDVDATLERQGITTREWAGLLETFGRLGSARGWFGDDGQQALQALLRTRRGPAADPAPRSAPAAGPAGPDQKVGRGALEYGQAVPGARIAGRG